MLARLFRFRTLALATAIVNRAFGPAYRIRDLRKTRVNVPFGGRTHETTKIEKVVAGAIASFSANSSRAGWQRSHSVFLWRMLHDFRRIHGSIQSNVVKGLTR